MGAQTPARRNKTAKEVADRIGASPRTVRRIIAEPRSDYEARAAARRADAVRLRLSGKKYREIADEMGCSIGTVSSLITKARKLGEIPTTAELLKRHGDAKAD